MSNQKITGESMQARYENAQKVLQGFISKKAAINTNVYPTWIGETDCFWYVRDLKGGKQFRLVNAKAASNEPAFDHQQLAAVLADAVQQEIDANDLPFSDIDLNLDARTIRFSAFDKHWEFKASEGLCEEVVPVSSTVEEVVSPDGKFLIFGKEHNLWLRNLENGEERALTEDGEEHYSYGSPSTAWGFSSSNDLQVLWSPDSRHIFTTQRDTREVEALPVVHHVPTDESIRPQVTSHRFAYPGDEHIETLCLLAINIKTSDHQSADYPQIPVTRNNWSFFIANLGWWNKDSRLAYFVDVDRYYKYARLIEFDTATGKTKILFEEKSDTQINLMSNGDMWPSFVPLPETNELLWYSERSGWAHLYLYDLATGRLKNTVTQGNWLVRDVVSVDSERREAFIQTACRTPGRNPYYRALVRVALDAGEMVTLVSSDHDYFAGAFTDMQRLSFSGKDRRSVAARGTSPTGNYSVITQLRVDTLPESLILDRDGKQVLTLETAEIVGMPENWQWPEPVMTTASDGKTELYGVIYKPSSFTPDQSYPVINDLFSTPDFPWASIGPFDNSLFEGQSFFTAAALAELGFIVVQIEGRGASYRDKAFKDAGYGNLQAPIMVADQIAGIKQLVERHPYMDLTRVAAHESQGGPAVMHGMLDYPGFYQVSVTNWPHDARLMSASMWGHMYEGNTAHKNLYPEEKVNNLQGKLLLLNGMLDICTPPASVFRIAEALQKANKDFDMVLLPNLGHGFSSYIVRRTWDYFVQHLLDEEPPKEFQLSGLFGTD